MVLQAGNSCTRCSNSDSEILRRREYTPNFNSNTDGCQTLIPNARRIRGVNISFRVCEEIQVRVKVLPMASSSERPTSMKD